MKKIWIFTGVMVFLLFLCMGIIFYSISNIIKVSENEIYNKQSNIARSEIVKILYNDSELSEIEAKTTLHLLKLVKFNKNEISLRTKERNYNNILEFIEDDGEKTELRFYFENSCNGSRVEVEKGMISIEAYKLCEYLTEMNN